MPQKQKLPLEKKVKTVKRCLAGELSIRGAAAEAGVDRNTIRRGIVQYKIEGEAAFLANRRSHVYSPELKLQAVQEYLSGKGSLAEISKNISCGVELNSEIG